MSEEQQLPPWIKRGKVDEVGFCEQFRRKHGIAFVDGAFFNVNGRIHNEIKLKQKIYDELRPYLTFGLNAAVDNLLHVMRMECAQEKISQAPFQLHVANGVYDLATGFDPEMSICRHRLPVAYRPDAKEPTLWLKFVHELLQEDDVKILQEYMGYCLLPYTKAQKMLIITGRGGEGKSRIGVVMKKILGNNMSMGSIAKIEASPFARADLEHILLFVDDDLKMEGLKSTNYIKSIITAEVPMDLERKGIQSYQGNLYVRFMTFGNGALKALYDRSHGFFRRQIVLNAKPVPEDRVDDPYLSERLSQEIEGIFLWCIEGLERLILNNYKFTVSHSAEDNMKDLIAESNNVKDFLSSDGYIRLDPTTTTSSTRLYECYMQWCNDNMTSPLSRHSFATSLRSESCQFGLTYDNNVPIGQGRRARGYKGIYIIPR